jgi:hypothetical protein
MKSKQLKKLGFWAFAGAFFWHLAIRGYFQLNASPGMTLKICPQLEPITWALVALGVILLIASHVARTRQVALARAHLHVAEILWQKEHPLGREGRQ